MSQPNPEQIAMLTSDEVHVSPGSGADVVVVVPDVVVVGATVVVVPAVVVVGAAVVVVTVQEIEGMLGVPIYVPACWLVTVPPH